ncbi:Rpn family recombination-promoting nuclease/putative transposase, partial [Prevotella sp.]
MARYINPFSDWSFKRIFGQEYSKDLLIEFLNQLLLGEQHITDVKFKDKEMLPETKDQRGIIYDVFCETDTGEHIIVEMQNRSQTYFIDRSLYYASKTIVEQGIKGKWDYHLTPVYVICFMNFDVDENTPKKFRTDVVLADKDSGEV